MPYKVDNEDKIAFVDMSLSEKNTLKLAHKAGQEIQLWDSLSFAWYTVKDPTWSTATVYRTKPQEKETS